MASIQERRDRGGKVTYRVQVRVKGHPPQSASFERKTDARRWGESTEAAIREDRYLPTVEARRHTVAEMIDRYVRDVLPRKSEASIVKQSQQFKWWKDQLGHFVLSDVTPAMIAEHRDALASQTTRFGTPAKGSTVNRYLAALSHAFTICVKEWGWLNDSPMRRVSKLREPRGRVRFLSDDERSALLSACGQSPNPCLYDVVIIALSSGMRKREILDLTWDQIDIARGVITLSPDDTKNSEYRVVPLVGHASEVLQKRSKIRRIDSPYVFPAPRRKGEPKPIDIQTSWYAALKKAEIENFRFHDLRHSAASYLAMNGATLPEIAAVLGHKTLQMVQRYAHLSDAHTAGVVERMNRAVFGDLTDARTR